MYTPEHGDEQAVRIGVYVCHCGTNIAGVVNVPDVVEYAKTLPNVVYAENNLYTCSNDAQDRIKAQIAEHNLNRVVVASCTPRTHEPLFRNTLAEAGLNPYLFEMANIRDQCSWVHMHEPKKATQKSKDLVRMAVAKARLLQPLKRQRVRIERSASKSLAARSTSVVSPERETSTTCCAPVRRSVSSGANRNSEAGTAEQDTCNCVVQSAATT